MRTETGAFWQRQMVKCRKFGFLQGAKSAKGFHFWGVSVKLRKAITTVVVGCAVAAVGAGVGVATAAGPQVGGKKCGTKYTPGCKHHPPPPPPAPPPQFTKPQIKTPPVSPKCIDTGGIYRLPTVTFTAQAGIRRIQVREGSHTVKLVTFKGSGHTKYLLRGLKVHTTGLGAGGHQLSVRVTDARGRSASKTLRFSVCVATPVFTG